MKRPLILVFLLTIVVFFASACVGSRPLKKETLADEASRYTASFQRSMHLAHYHAAMSDALRALEVARILDRKELIAFSLNNLGAAQERLELTVEAENSYGGAVNLSRGSDLPRILAASLNNLAGLVVEKDPGKSETLALESLEIGRQHSWMGVMARAFHNRARAALQGGEVQVAVELGRKALDHASTADEQGTRAAVLVTLGRAEGAMGDPSAGIRLIEEALIIDRELQDPNAIAMDYTRLAEIQEMAGKADDARSSRQKAQEIRKFWE
jgi:tetratricopeptide (TPR) repeat protein